MKKNLNRKFKPKRNYRKSLEFNNEISKKIENLNKKIDNLISNKELKLINTDNEQSQNKNILAKFQIQKKM